MNVLKVTTKDGAEQCFEDCHAITRDGVLLILEDDSKRCVAAYTCGDWKRFARVIDKVKMKAKRPYCTCSLGSVDPCPVCD